MKVFKVLFCLASILLVLISRSACARTWRITSAGSGDAPTIQAGIDSAAAGDMVLLADGVYTGAGHRDMVYCQGR
jgi:hypothetical protein